LIHSVQVVFRAAGTAVLRVTSTAVSKIKTGSTGGGTAGADLSSIFEVAVKWNTSALIKHSKINSTVALGAFSVVLAGIAVNWTFLAHIVCDIFIVPLQAAIVAIVVISEEVSWSASCAVGQRNASRANFIAGSTDNGFIIKIAIFSYTALTINA